MFYMKENRKKVQKRMKSSIINKISRKNAVR